MKWHIKLVWFMVLWFPVAVSASLVERYVEGVHYSVIDNDKLPENMPPVMEFFSYGCPHCYALEPKMHEWEQKKLAPVAKIPALWGKKFRNLGQLYYTLDALGLAETAHQKVFDYIHKERRRLDSKSDALEFCEAIGVKPDDFEKAWNSEQVSKRLVQADALARAYVIKGVPALVINGKYQTSVSMAGSQEALFSIVEFLLSK